METTDPSPPHMPEPDATLLSLKLVTLSPEERVEMRDMVGTLGEQAVLDRWELLLAQIRYVLTL